MDNVSPLEVAWVVPGLMFMVPALVILAFAIRLLRDRYQEARNGAVKRLAWQFVLVISFSVAGLLAVLGLGVIAMLLPASASTLDTDFERSVVGVAVWLTPLLLFTMEAAFGATAITLGVIQFMLWSFYDNEGRERVRRWEGDEGH